MAESEKKLDIRRFQTWHISWFPAKRLTWAGKRTTIAGFTHEARKVRNLVHPGEYGRREWLQFNFTRGIHAVVDEICDVATTQLRYRVEEDILKKMKRGAAPQLRRPEARRAKATS